MLRNYKIEAFKRPVSDLADNPKISAGELKRHFDSNSYELKDSLNGVIDTLLGDDSLDNFKLSGKTAGELLDEKADKKELLEDKERTEKLKRQNLNNYGDRNIYPSDESLFVFEVSEDKSYYVLRELSDLYSEDITELVIPYEYNGLPVRRIGYWWNYDAFEECEPFVKGKTSLKKVILPNSITKMGAMLFNELTALKEVRLSENCPLKPATFLGCSAIKEVKLPEITSSIPWQCFEGCASLRVLDLPVNVSTINSGAFTGCESLALYIPDSVTNIETGGLEDLKKITIPPSSTYLKEALKDYNLCFSEVYVEDNLLSESETSALSAKQGKVLKNNIEAVAEAHANIEAQTQVIKSDIEAIQEQINEEAHFRGYLSTNSKIQALNGTPNDFAYSAESSTKWVYDEELGWEDTGTPVPDQLTPASDLTPLISGEASTGISETYARGDHRHPTDTTRASVEEVNALKSDVESAYDELRAYAQQIDNRIGDVESALDELHNYALGITGDVELDLDDGIEDGGEI